MSDHVLSDILDWFWEIEEWIPGIHSTVGEIIFGPIPLSDGARLYDLAEAWGEVAQGLAEAYEEVRPAADSIIESWSGDAAAMQFAQQWMSYLEALRTTADSVSSMQQGVQGLALQVEMMKFMAVINLIMLAVSLYIIIAALIPSAGASLGGVPPALAACRTAMWAAVRKIVQAITGITFRTALKGLGQFATRALPAGVRAAPRVLPTVVRAVPRAATTTGRGLGTVARNTFTRLTPRNVVARTVADRLAGQAMNRAARRALRNQLGRGLGSRAAANAARSQVARELQQQILANWGARTAAQAAGRTAANSAARYAGNQMLERAVQQGLARAATEATEVAFRRELAKYLGIRVAFGAGFLGGGDLLGQGLQVLDGNRSGIDMTQTAVTAAQGAAFGLGMWGGLGGHILGGAAAGGMVGLGTAMASEEGFDWRDPDDWAKVGHEAAKGGMAGAIFGAQNNLEMVRVNAPSRIGGADIRTLPDSLAAGSRASGGLPGGLAGARSGEGFAPGLGDGVGSLPDGDGIGLRRDGESAPRAPETETPRGVVAPALPVVDALTRGEALPTRGGDGGAGPGPRQPATPAPSGGSSPRAADQVRDEGGAGPGAIERTPVPVEPVRVGDDAPPPRDPDAPGRGGDEFVSGRDHEGYFPDRTGEDLDSLWGRENFDFRDPGEDGPPVGDREGVGTGEATGRGPEPPVLGRVREDSPLSPGAEQVAGEGLVRGVAGERVPYRLVPVEPVSATRVAEVPDAVAAVIDQHVTGLLDGRTVDAADQPHRATWDPESGTLTVHYPDGLEAHVVLQVNSSLPPGHPTVLRPTMEFVHGAWRQADAAGVILPAHAPPDGVTRTDFVHQEIDNAWRALHEELRDLLPAEPLPDAPRADGPALAPRTDEVPLAVLEEGNPDVPVLDADQVTFRDAGPADPRPHPPWTPESIRDALTDRSQPEPVVRAIADHLADRADDGSFAPRSAVEVTATLARLEQEAARMVAGSGVDRTGTDTSSAAGGHAAARVGHDGTPAHIMPELAPSENLPPHVTRTGADLPQQVHELAARAKENLLARYPEHAVQTRIRDLDAIVARADALDAAAARARATGDLGELVQSVRDLSRSVNDYADQYRNWRDFTRDGEHADPGWRDVDGIDPLNSVEMANRAIGIDPSTHRFHVIDQAIAVAKIEEILGPEFAAHALQTLDRVVPKDPDSVRALVPPEAVTPELMRWVEGPARGGYDTRIGATFIDPRSSGEPRPISAFAATLVHESMHSLQPNAALVIAAMAEAGYPPAARDLVRAHLRFEAEFGAFAVQRHFVEGLAGFRPAEHSSDARVPKADGLRELADWTPQQIEDFVRSRYLSEEGRRLVGPDVVGRHPELTIENSVNRARLAILEANHPLPGERQHGTLYGPVTARMAEQYGIDLHAIGQRQGETIAPPLRDEAPAGERAKAAEPGVRDPDTLMEERGRGPEEDDVPHPDTTSPGDRIDDAPGYSAPVRAADLHPDTRTPLLPGHGAQLLADLRGDHVYTVSRTEALLSGQWAGLRDSSPPVAVARPDSPFNAAAEAQARRVSVVDAGGHARAVTEVTLRIRYQADPAVTPEALDRARSNLLDGTDLYFNHQHRLPDGSQFHLRVELERVEFDPLARITDVVTLHPGRGDGPGDSINQMSWHAEMDPVVFAHEVGHHLGLADEYVQPGAEGRRTLTAQSARLDASVMGHARLFWADGGLVRDHAGQTVPALAGLRDRHLAQLGEMLPGLDLARGADGPAARGSEEGRGGAEGPRHRNAEPLAVAALRLPPHVQRLLETFHPDGHTPLDHARRLDRMHALFGDRLSVDRMTGDHLRYTDALVGAASRIYQAAPDFSFSARDLGRLRALADMFGARPGGPLPDAEAMVRHAQDVLGGEGATVRQVDGLARLAQWFEATGGVRLDGESPVAALRRAAGELLGEAPGPAAARAATDVLTRAAEAGNPMPDWRTVDQFRFGDDGAIRFGADGRPFAEPPRVSEVGATGRLVPSRDFAEPHMMRQWDELHAGRLDELVNQVRVRTDLSVPEKMRLIQDELLARFGYQPARVEGNLDMMNLRFYEWQSGELFIHASAMMLRPEATIEVAYEPHQHFTEFRDDVSDAFLANLGDVPQGLTRDLVDRAVLWRSVRGLPLDDLDPVALANHLIDMQVRPLKNALAMRDRLIREYSIDPRRVRLSYDDQPREVHYANSKFRRAHLVALPKVRESPVQARQTMADAMRGDGERGARREARARQVAQEIYARHETPGTPKKYALLWVRRTHVPMGAFMDTKPELLRQTIETIRAVDPDRQIMLIGDDLFEGRPQLRAQFAAEGVLAGVDLQTLQHFWERPDGRLGHGEQTLFLHYLNLERDIVQIGMESGALETAITMGVPTVYFQGLEHVGDKGVRWQLYWDEWSYGHSVQARSEDGSPLFFESRRPIMEFHPAGERLPPPLNTIRRVEFGPGLPDPADRLTPPVAVYYPATISATADRVIQLVERGELERWPERMGRSWSQQENGWRAWDAAEWDASHYYAGQAYQWLHAEPSGMAAAAHRWSALGHALAGVLDPHSRDVAGAYREGGFHAAGPLPDELAARLREAYAAPPAERGQAVVRVLQDLLDVPDLSSRASSDLRMLRLTPDEIAKLREAIEHVVNARNAQRVIEPWETPPGTTGQPPAGPRDR